MHLWGRERFEGASTNLCPERHGCQVGTFREAGCDGGGARRTRRGRRPRPSRQVPSLDRGATEPAAGRDHQLRDRPALVRPGRRATRPARGHRHGAALLLPRGPGAGADSPRGREDPRLLGLPRPAQRSARPVQGRHPLPSGGGPGRGPCAGRADDLEDRDRRTSVRRRQGRRERRAEQAARGRAAGREPLVHGQDREGPGPHPRHPGARRGDRRPGDGLAHGRVRQAPRPHARLRHRQADRARGLIRP